MRIAIVKAAFDDDAGVWWVEHSDIEGLHVEGETFEAFRQNVADATVDLVLSDSDGTQDTPVKIVAHTSAPARAVA